MSEYYTPKKVYPPQEWTDNNFLSYLLAAIEQNGTPNLAQVKRIKAWRDHRRFFLDEKQGLVVAGKIEGRDYPPRTVFVRLSDNFATDNPLDIWPDSCNDIWEETNDIHPGLEEFQSTKNMLAIAMGCQIRQSEIIQRYREFAKKIVPSILSRIPGTSLARLNKICKEVCILIEECVDDLPEDLFYLAEGIIDVQEGD